MSVFIAERVERRLVLLDVGEARDGLQEEIVGVVVVDFRVFAGDEVAVPKSVMSQPSIARRIVPMASAWARHFFGGQ